MWDFVCIYQTNNYFLSIQLAINNDLFYLSKKKRKEKINNVYYFQGHKMIATNGTTTLCSRV